MPTANLQHIHYPRSIWENYLLTEINKHLCFSLAS